MKKSFLREKNFRLLLLWFSIVFVILFCLTFLYIKKYEDGLFWIAIVSIVILGLSAEVIKFYLKVEKEGR